METSTTKKSNKTLWIVLIILAVVVICCILATIGGFAFMGTGLNFFANEMFTEDPVEVHQIASDIMDYDLPPGYEEQMAMNMFGLGDMVILVNDDRGQVIAFLQFKAGIPMDEEQVRHQMQSSIQRQGETQMTYVGEWPATIRGQEVMVQEYEGISEEGIPMRELITVFEGKAGNIFLMIMGADSTWDQSEIENFMESIN